MCRSELPRVRMVTLRLALTRLRSITGPAGSCADARSIDSWLTKPPGKTFPPISVPADWVRKKLTSICESSATLWSARNYRSSRRRGKVDLIGWEGEVLCFIEVKTRTTHDLKPAEAAVNLDKQRELGGVAREYLRHLRVPPTSRFDVISVYYDHRSGESEMELFKNAF